MVYFLITLPVLLTKNLPVRKRSYYIQKVRSAIILIRILINFITLDRAERYLCPVRARIGNAKEDL